MLKSTLIFVFLGLILASCSSGQENGSNTTKLGAQVKNNTMGVNMSCTNSVENIKIEIHAKDGKVMRKIYGTDIEGPKQQIKLEETNYLLMDGEKEYKWKDTIINGKAQENKAWSRTLSDKDKLAYEKVLSTEKPEFITAMTCTAFSATDTIFEIPSDITFIDQDEDYNKLTPEQKDEVKIGIFSM
ncbi:hypothetical protein KBC86_02340 [Candidatus Gracilibacteria bacterium]|nr:hypothetical protein [Candidatus Gracilibacteria bacterium]